VTFGPPSIPGRVTHYGAYLTDNARAAPQRRLRGRAVMRRVRDEWKALAGSGR